MKNEIKMDAKFKQDLYGMPKRTEKRPYDAAGVVNNKIKPDPRDNEMSYDALMKKVKNL